MKNVLRQSVSETVSRLFADSKTPLEHFGIDGDKIEQVERAHPEVAKHIPLSKRVS
jgi:hypothetical protein